MSSQSRRKRLHGNKPGGIHPESIAKTPFSRINKRQLAQLATGQTLETTLYEAQLTVPPNLKLIAHIANVASELLEQHVSASDPNDYAIEKFARVAHEARTDYARLGGAAIPDIPQPVGRKVH